MTGVDDIQLDCVAPIGLGEVGASVEDVAEDTWGWSVDTTGADEPSLGLTFLGWFWWWFEVGDDDNLTWLTSREVWVEDEELLPLMASFRICLMTAVALYACCIPYQFMRQNDIKKHVKTSASQYYNWSN